MIEVVKVKNQGDGNAKAHEILKEIVDPQTLLALSGGTTPDYRKMIVEPADIPAGAICVVDERFGEPLHTNSNELLLETSGLVEYLNFWGIEFHKILRGKEFKETAQDYEKTLADLFDRFKKRLGIMGIGSNLHTAGIFPNSKAATSDQLVIAETVEDQFPQRITMTFRALEKFQTFIILAFGEEKREAIKKMLDEKETDIQRYPAVFYRTSGIKTYLITDQRI